MPMVSTANAAPPKVYVHEKDCIRAIKDGGIHEGDIIVFDLQWPYGHGHDGDLSGHRRAEASSIW